MTSFRGFYELWPSYIVLCKSERSDHTGKLGGLPGELLPVLRSAYLVIQLPIWRCCCSSCLPVAQAVYLLLQLPAAYLFSHPAL
jgi:hypothetical protein